MNRNVEMNLAEKQPICCPWLWLPCHIRLVHYSSKSKQDDDTYKQQDHWGRENLQLIKIVNKHWLLRRLAPAKSRGKLAN